MSKLVKCVPTIDLITRICNRPIELLNNKHRDIAFRTLGVDQGLQWNVVDKSISCNMKLLGAAAKIIDDRLLRTDNAVFLKDRQTFS